MSNTTYREYDASTGNEVTGGLTIDLNTLAPDCYWAATGVALAPDGQSLYIVADFATLIQTDLEGRLLGAHAMTSGSGNAEDIDVIVP